MSKDDIEGLFLLVVVFVGCWYHNQLADLLGLFLNQFLF